MKKIILVSPYPPPIGGIATWTKSVVDYFTNDKKINIDVFDCSYKTQSSIHNHKIRKIIFALKKTNKAIKFIKSQQDVSLVHISSSGGLGFYRDYKIIKHCKKFGIKTLLHLHYGNTDKDYRRCSLISFFLKKCIKLSDGIISIDSNTYSFLQQQKAKAFYLPNFIDSKLLNYQQTAKNNTVLFGGWVVKTKGIEELLSAWSKIRKDNWLLKIVGPYNPKYLQELKQKFYLNNVVFVGSLERNELLSLMRQSKILALPSYTEGFPMIVLEAMANNMAIISTSVGDLKNILSNDAGIVIEPKNETQLAESLLSLMENPSLLEKYSRAAKQRVEEKYVSKEVCSALNNIWDKFEK